MIQTAGTPGDSPPGGQTSPPPTPTATAGGPDPARLLNLGPQYIRNRYLKREPGMERRNRRSAVELLEESKSLYVKSESVRDHKQVLKLETRHHRRSTYSPPTGEAESGGGQQSGSRSSADATPSSPCSSSTSVTGGGGRTPPASIINPQTWPVGLQPQPDSPAADYQHQQQQQQLDQCHNVTTAAPPVTTRAPRDTPIAPSPRLLQGDDPLCGQGDQVDSCGEGRGQLSDALPCPHGLLTNRPCDECLNSNTTTSTTTTSTTTTTTNAAATTDILHCTPRPPPPVPPKPSNEHHSQQQQQQQQQQQGTGGGGGPGPGGGGVGGARQPPPVPPKRHSSISLTDNNTGSSSISSSTNTAALVGGGGGSNSSKAPPPVPPKPSAEDRSSVYQPDTTGAKWRPPPVPPKPSSASPTPPLPQLHPVQQQPLWRAANNNGMEADPALPAGSGVVVVRPKSAGVDSPRSSSGSTPPPPPPVPPKPRPSLMGSEMWREAHTDTSSEIDQHSSSSLVKVDDKLVMVRRRPRKFHRSRSDLTKRFSNSSDLSELSARFSRNSADLEKFFNEMGLDRSVLEPMMMSACQRSASDLHLFESASSVDSPDIRSWCSEDDGEHPLKHEVVEERTPPGGPASIVERNARIIKWLCSVKKAASHEEPLTEQ